jgi:acyl-CoA synthetase (AMP-forming)/AMP-acid ligase II
MMHGAAQWAALGALFTASTVVLTPKFDAHEVWRLVDQEKVNVMAITGDAMARPMIEAYGSGSHDGSTLLALSSGAAIFSSSVKQQYLETFPDIVLTDTIGSSETGFSGIGVISKDDQDHGGPRVNRGEGTIVIDEHGNPLEPGSRGVGRLARSGHIPLRYHKDPDKTARTFTEVNGVRYAIPGDMARVEDDGTITLLGRGSVCINTGGEKVFPEEVEEVLKTHDHVRDAVAVGVPDEKFGEAITAVIELVPGAAFDEGDIVVHVKEKLAAYKAPKRVLAIDTIGRAPNGKVDYKRLKGWAADELGVPR